jgi:hypothetical protein
MYQVINDNEDVKKVEIPYKAKNFLFNGENFLEFFNPNYINRRQIRESRFKRKHPKRGYTI